MPRSVLVLTASPSLRSRTAALAWHVADDLALDGHAVRFLSLRDLPPAALLSGNTRHPALAAAVHEVIAADAVVVATPVYKAAYSGLLKVFLDALPQHALDGKVVLPLATGGTLAHLLALDYALRPVLVALGASHVTAGRFVLDTHLDPGDGTGEGAVVLDERTRDCLVRTSAAFRDALTAFHPDRRPVLA